MMSDAEQDEQLVDGGRDGQRRPSLARQFASVGMLARRGRRGRAARQRALIARDRGGDDDGDGDSDDSDHPRRKLSSDRMLWPN